MMTALRETLRGPSYREARGLRENEAMGFKDWFKDPPPKKERMGTRQPAPELVAIHPSEEDVKEDLVKDISATGIYILTEDRWDEGTPVSLTLHRRSTQHEDSEDDFTLPAKTVRSGEDGVGLTFELPKDVDPATWVSLVEGASREAGPDNIVGQFKLAEGVAFLDRICPNAEKEFRQKFCTELSSGRFKHAIEIAIKAEQIVTSWPDAENPRANSALLARILEYGSWADEHRTQELWAGILAIACAPEKNDEANLDIVERLSQFALVHYRIFTTACARATKVISADGLVTAQPLIFTADEILNIAGSRDIGRVARDIQHLYDLGFLASKNIPSSYVEVVELNLAPTTLGLKLFSLFHAHRGSLESFYGLGAPAQAGAKAT